MSYSISLKIKCGSPVVFIPIEHKTLALPNDAFLKYRLISEICDGIS